MYSGNIGAQRKRGIIIYVDTYPHYIAGVCYIEVVFDEYILMEIKQNNDYYMFIAVNL